MKPIMIISILLIIAFTAGILIDNLIFTARVIDQSDKESIKDLSKNYTWTTAICNQEKECIDVTINCENERVKSIIPSSKLIRNNKSWIDPRGNTSKFCS